MGAGVGLLALGLSLLCLFTVATGRVAVVTQFGNPIRVETAPGLHAKYPYTLQSVITFDQRLHIINGIIKPWYAERLVP